MVDTARDGEKARVPAPRAAKGTLHRTVDDLESGERQRLLLEAHSIIRPAEASVADEVPEGLEAELAAIIRGALAPVTAQLVDLEREAEALRVLAAVVRARADQAHAAVEALSEALNRAHEALHRAIARKMGQRH